MTISAKQILSKVGCPYLSLCKGAGYWYFVYDNTETGAYESHTVYEMYLNQASLDWWVNEGKQFVSQMENDNV